ncbi:MAG: hypothetical protein ACRC0G_07715 [Fusobacteriaceae bacterium]
MNLDILILGEELTPAERKKLPDDAFGVPSDRKFPLVDKGHVISAMSYFHSYTGDKIKKDELAIRIFNSSKKYGVHLNPDSNFMKYYNNIEEKNILQESSISGFSYYAEFPETLIPRYIDGFNPSLTPNEILDYKNSMDTDGKKHLKEFIDKVETTIVTGDRVEYLDMIGNFPDMYMRAIFSKSESYRGNFVEKWKNLVELANGNDNALLCMGVHPDTRVRNLVTEAFVPNKFNELYQTLKEGFEYMDMSENVTMEDMDELLEEPAKVPIYVVLTKGTHMTDRIVTSFTRTPFGHASVTFDLSLDKLYSFGYNNEDRNPNKRLLTFIEQDKAEINKLNENKVEYHVYAIFVDKEKKIAVERQIRVMIKNKVKFNYNYMGILGYVLNTPVKIKDAFFCSEFISTVFRNAGIELFDKPDQLVAPHDFAFNKKFVKIDSGILAKYKPEKASKKVNRILKKHYSIVTYREGSLFKFKRNVMDMLLCERYRLTNNKLPLEIDAEGNITFHKLGTPDYASVFAESHRLLMAYNESGDIESMKYELAKLWVCIRGIENKIYGDTRLSPEDKRKMINTRALIINDFKKYLKVVLEKEDTFNFEQYYKESEFNNTVFKISKYSIRGAVALVKELLL